MIITELTIKKPDAELADLLDRAARGERIIIRRKGKKAAVLLPLTDMKLVEKIEDEIDHKLVKQVLNEKHKAVPYEQVRKKLRLVK